MANRQPESELNWEAASGRLRLELKAVRMGQDLLVSISGGEAHIGAVAVASREQLQLFELPQHREGKIAAKVAQKLAAELQCAVAACCGIHFDKISREEIDAVGELAENLTSQCAACFKKR